MDVTTLTDEIFGGLGYELSEPKDYVISIANYFFRNAKKFEWLDNYQLDNISITPDQAEFNIILVNSLFPFELTINVQKQIGYNTKGISYLTYKLEMEMDVELEYVTRKFVQAEEFLITQWNDMSVKVETDSENEKPLFMLTGQIENSFEIEFIPFAADELPEEEKRGWSKEIREQTNFGSIALEISNFLNELDELYTKVDEASKWFKERKIYSYLSINSQNLDSGFDESSFQ